MKGTKTFEFSSALGVEYILTVTELGFSLVDVMTDELLIDASILVRPRDEKLPYWPIEIEANSLNREWYISYGAGDRIEFGLSRRERNGPLP